VALEPRETRGERGGLNCARRFGPDREEGDLGGAIGQTDALWVEQEAQGKAGVEGGHGDVKTLDAEKRAPSAATDFELIGAAATNAPRAVRRGIAGEEFFEPRAKIDLPMSDEPFGLRGRRRRIVDFELRGLARERVNFFDPTGAGVGETVVSRDVRLEIEDRRPLDEITFTEDEAPTLDRDELHGREPEGIGAMRRTRGEDPAPLRGTAGRDDLGAPRGVAMKPPDEPDAGKTGEIAESLLVIVAGDELEHVALGLLLGRLMERLKLDLFARADVADGLERKRGGSFGHRGTDQSFFAAAGGGGVPARRTWPRA